MTTLCDRCKAPPVIFIRYSGQHLCSDHFLDLIRRRVKKEVRRQGSLLRRKRIGIAVSGGKDSLLALKLIHEIISTSRGKDLIALTIDEGISGYRPSSMELASGYADHLGVEHVITSFRELHGADLDEMVGATGMGPCTVCGILRRNSLNRIASTNGIDVLITGHNLDDMAQTILMNVMDADVQRLSRLGPHLHPIPGFVPRSMILRTTPETETYLAALLLGIPIHGVQCPYSPQAKRGFYRDILLKVEEETPGSRHSLLRFQEQISPLIERKGAKTGVCPSCGEAIFLTNGGEKCKACAVLEKMGVRK
ncbi:MAG: ATP-binding protein [Thermoplasmatota archaeon]